MAIIERLNRAVNSKNLAQEDWLCDLDFVIASGFAARRRAVGGLAFWAKYANDRERMAQFQAHATHMVIGKLRQRRIHAPREELEACIASALNWWLDDVCKGCNGLKFQVDGQQLSDRVCPVCHGSGKRRTPALHESNLDWTEHRWESVLTQTLMTVEDAMGDYLRIAKGKTYER